MSGVRITIGCTEFWPEFYKAQGPRLHIILKLPALLNLMFSAVDARSSTTRVETVVRFFVQTTLVAMNDVLLLCGNGSGSAALRIVRGMFESSTIAEYVRRTPEAAEDYLQFRPVIAWRRYQWMLKNVPEKSFANELVSRMERQYESVKARFDNGKGKVRTNWSKCKIHEMAHAIGRREQYELVYSWLSAMHHLNPEALFEYIEDRNGTPMIRLDCAPSQRWIKEALIAAHTYVLFAAQTFSDCFSLRYEQKIRAAEEEFEIAGRACSD
jgi:hypothetical protein